MNFQATVHFEDKDVAETAVSEMQEIKTTLTSLLATLSKANPDMMREISEMIPHEDGVLPLC